MTRILFLFCGGPAIYPGKRPKPLMRVHARETLLSCYLRHLRPAIGKEYEKIVILCDDEQRDAYEAEVSRAASPSYLQVFPCGRSSSTFTKFCDAVNSVEGGRKNLHFTYPDIFVFPEKQLPGQTPEGDDDKIFISAAVFTSRFPQLFIDSYRDEIKGISNYTSAVPANPVYVFGGDIWARSDVLLASVAEFMAGRRLDSPSLEHDFLFWLINRRQLACRILSGEHLKVDSPRDVVLLRSRLRQKK